MLDVDTTLEGDDRCDALDVITAVENDRRNVLGVDTRAVAHPVTGKNDRSVRNFILVSSYNERKIRDIIFKTARLVELRTVFKL